MCLDDGKTEAEGVPSQGGRGDALNRRIPPLADLVAEAGERAVRVVDDVQTCSMRIRFTHHCNRLDQQ